MYSLQKQKKSNTHKAKNTSLICSHHSSLPGVCILPLSFCIYLVIFHRFVRLRNHEMWIFLFLFWHLLTVYNVKISYRKKKKKKTWPINGITYSCSRKTVSMSVCKFYTHTKYLLWPPLKCTFTWWMTCLSFKIMHWENLLSTKPNYFLIFHIVS